MTPSMIVAALLVLAVLLASTRLILWQRSAGSGYRSRAWRIAALLLLQPICAALLYFCLFPPGTRIAAGTLTIATAGTPRNAVSEAGGRIIALPEAPTIAGAEAVPDLATALRRHAGTARITILGEGLTARDREATSGLAVAFTPAPPRPGLVALMPPSSVAPGGAFTTGGRVAGYTGATIDLIDPAGRVTDNVKVGADGNFTLSGTARAAGTMTFAIRLRDAAGRQIERADLPVIVDAATAPRLLIMAGAPGPEVKYLRRWATDAGFAVTTRMSAGGGIELGDAPVAIDATSLRRFDVAIIDDRSWTALGNRRGAMIAAVRDGLGLLLRPSGPLDASARGQWRALGITLSGANGLAPITLPAPQDAAIAATRRGIGRIDGPSPGSDAGEPYLPEISRLDTIPGGNDTVPLIRDGAGTPLASWRALGNGRIAAWTGIDSYGLSLTGQSDLYGQWWSNMLSTIARPATSNAAPAFTGPAWMGERVPLCGLAADATVRRPDGRTTTIHRDPATPGCAAFWPDQPGWYELGRQDSATEIRIRPFYVQSADAMPTARSERIRQATLMLRAASPTATASHREGSEERPGSPWPWFVGLTLAFAVLWWLERARWGRRADGSSV